MKNCRQERRFTRKQSATAHAMRFGGGARPPRRTSQKLSVTPYRDKSDCIYFILENSPKSVERGL
ncbi:hypothetical protein KIN20_030830 [Parelaphostrongylus tenuis]|uniref:Uncharacterized protein n=1 Tax=Parelaphostrongylus tenuis TaxID=148309 RepID=A0AAD5R4A3_PARTN|nr:hypothetical protein KIN20_030830 [Parelaphostrongylus tenuis]